MGVIKKFQSPLLLVIMTLAIIITALGGADRFIDGRIWDWGHFYYAAEALMNGQSPYASGERGYIYPVTFAWLLQPLALLGFKTSAVIFILTMGVLLLATTGLLIRLLTLINLRFQTVTLAVFIAFVLVADKFTSTLKNAQTDGILLASITWAALALRTHPISAGLAIALAASIKYHAILFLALFLIRGHWRAAVACIVGFLTLLLVPALTIGWGTNWAYLGDAFGGLVNMANDAPMVRSGSDLPSSAAIAPISWERSISLTSAFARLSNIMPQGFGALAYLALATLIAGTTALAAWGYQRAGVNPFGLDRARQPLFQSSHVDVCDFALVTTVMIVFAPQATARHFIYALLPLAVVALSALQAQNWRVKAALLSGCAAFFFSLNLPLSEFPELMNAWRAWSMASWSLLGLTLSLPFVHLSQIQASPSYQHASKQT